MPNYDSSESDYDMSSNDEECSNDFETDSGSDIIIPSKRLRIISDSSDDEEVTASASDGDNIDEFLPVNTIFSNESNSFFEVPGPKNAPASDAKPIEYFNKFFSNSLFTTMVTETNRYAEQFLNSGKKLKRRSRAKSWVPVTVTEMRAFVAVLLEMGITRRPSIHSYWSKDSRNIPWFGKMFSRDRFQLILNFFHLVDNNNLAPPGDSGYDPCGKFNFLADYANKIFREQYTPHRQLSIDESLVGTHCHSIIKQYLPNKKHHKWGIKFWMICDSVSNYCLGFSCYQGAKSSDDKNEINKNGLGYVVVEKLLSLGNYLNKGYHLFIDNFFTSIHLAKGLLEKNTYLTGTIRRNRKYIPNEAKFAQVGQPKYFKNDKILMCSFRDKQTKKNPVILISTNCTTGNITVTKKKGNFQSVKEKPIIIHNYNQFMNGVDESDKMLYTYLDERRTLKYWKKVVFNIFVRMVLNSYIIYSENCLGKKLTRLQFTSSIIHAIEKEWLASKNETASPISKKFALEKLPGRNLRQCEVCSKKNGNGIKRSNLICAVCKKGIHGVCAAKHSCNK